MNSTEYLQEYYRNGLSKTALEFEKCKQQLLTLANCAYQRAGELKFLGTRLTTRSPSSDASGEMR